MIKIRFMLPVLLSIIVSVTFFTASDVTAQDGTETSPTVATFITIGQQVKTDPTGGRYTAIEAKLIEESGRPVSLRNITFFLIEDYFGLNSVRLGDAITNSIGIASIRYDTLREGGHQIEAVFTGDNQYIATKSVSTINITNLDTIENEETGTWSVHNAGLFVVGIIVILVWVLLILVLYKIFFSLRRSGNTL